MKKSTASSAPIIVLFLLLAFIAIVHLVSTLRHIATPSPTGEPVSFGAQIRAGDAPMPEFSTSTKDKLAASSGFQHLVSYTDTGFEPDTLTVEDGETVRFTNNSSDDIWIASDSSSEVIYPRTKVMCGSSDLDTCDPFPPQDFWEFTFTMRGTWGIVNNLDKTKKMTVILE